MPSSTQHDHPTGTPIASLTAALPMLACPVCHAALAMGADCEVLCTGCRRRYPVRDGIPVLIASESVEGNGI